MAKHTPGPWFRDTSHGPMGIGAGELGQFGRAIRVVGGCGCCDSPYGVLDSEEEAANARLIAAAPNLLEACEELLAEYAHLHALYNLGECDGSLMARAAIAKATGETE